MTKKLTYKELQERIKDCEILESYQNSKQQIILEAIHDGLWEHDFRNNVFKSSDRLFTMLGYSPMNGLEGYEFLVSKIHPEDKKIFEHEQQRIITSNTNQGLCTFRLQAADGSWRYILSRAKWIAADENGIGYHFIGTHTDITALKLVEKSLIESEARFKALHNASFGGITIHDKGVILDCNQGLSEITGYSMSELIGMDGLLLIAEKSRDFVMQNILSGYEKPYESVGLRKNGEEYPIRLEGRNIPYKGKDVRVVEFRDITEQKQMEIKQKELEAANLRLKKAESLNQMAGGIAHLFNNYLYAVSGNLELALEYLPDDSLIDDYLIEAMKASNRCADISGSMLTYLGQNFVKMESIDISKCCREHLPDLQSSFNNNITIDAKLSDAELIVRANTGQMQQILNHLITNACESIGGNNGIINLTTKTIPASGISKFHILPVDSKPSVNRYACLEVADTGCGISKEDIDRIFDPFFTTNFTGRGLGLAVVLGIIKSWDGMIGVKSKVGHGSSFIVLLPLIYK